MPDDDRPRDARARKLPQFGLGALLWTMFVIGLAFSFLRAFGSPIVFVYGLAAISVGLVAGLVIGGCFGRITDATYWSLMITTAAYLSVATFQGFGPPFYFAWASVGSLSGAFSGAISPAKFKLRVVVASITSGAAMLLFAGALSGRQDYAFDVVAAPVIGALVAVLVQIILWLEGQSQTPRYVTASWLLLAVIVGNLLVPLVLS